MRLFGIAGKATPFSILFLRYWDFCSFSLLRPLFGDGLMLLPFLLWTSYSLLCNSCSGSSSTRSMIGPLRFYSFTIRGAGRSTLEKTYKTKTIKLRWCDQLTAKSRPSASFNYLLSIFPPGGSFTSRFYKLLLEFGSPCPIFILEFVYQPQIYV